MTTSVQTFAFKTPGSDQPVNIRTIMLDGEPWFLAADACLCLGMNLAWGTRSWILNLKSDQKRVVTRLGHPEIFTGSRASQMSVINEAGLYRLIMRSTKPEALVFQAWVTDEVLPAIRKTGGYLLNETVRETAHADTRTEMPLPAAFQEAMNTLARANVLMGEKLARALVIMDRQDGQLTAQNAAMAR